MDARPMDRARFAFFPAGFLLCRPKTDRNTIVRVSIRSLRRGRNVPGGGRQSLFPMRRSGFHDRRNTPASEPEYLPAEASLEAGLARAWSRERIRPEPGRPTLCRA